MKQLKTTALWDWTPHEVVIVDVEQFETTVLWDWAPHEAVIRNAKRDGWAPHEAPYSVLGRTEENSSMTPSSRGCGRLQPPWH